MKFNARPLKIQDMQDPDANTSKLVDVLNDLIDQVKQLFGGGQVIGENVRGAVIEFNAASAIFPLRLKVPGIVPSPIGVSLVKVRALNNVAVGAAVGIDWFMDAGLLVIEGMPGLTAGTEYSVRILVI
jgi:hypothetical protein